MTAQPPTLAEQLEAIRWVLDHVNAMGEAACKLTSEIKEMRRCLEAAHETLQALEFGRMVLK